MKTISSFLSIAALFVSLSIFAQDLSGSWNGVLEVQGTKLRIVFNVDQVDGQYTATMDSPDQGIKGIEISRATVKNDSIKFEIPTAAILYTGLVKGENVAGTFKQGPLELPLNLTRGEPEKVKRPQEPKPPFLYYSEDVVFENEEADVKLAGTLTLPKTDGIYPVVILISGSGPQNRDEELVGHKPFLVLADHLTKKGIGVLRYDDRGTAQSTGDFAAATSADFATDVEAAIAYLKTRKEVDKNNIGLVGHSEGGLIAPMVAAKSKDVAFIVMLAGPGIDGGQILSEQRKLISLAAGMDSEQVALESGIFNGGLEMVRQSDDLDKLREDLGAYFAEAVKNNPSIMPEGTNIIQYTTAIVNQLGTPWFQNFIKYDPAVNLVKVTCPVLAINGEKDLQVPAQVNLEAIESALKKAGNTDFMVKEMASMNHLFQVCETGSPAEYGQIEETFSPIALEEVSGWILQRVK